MDETERKAAEVVARNIELLESAYKLAANEMDGVLHGAVAEIFEKTKGAFIWEGDSEDNLDDGPWLAPPEWRAEGEDVGGNYHLYCEINGHDEAETWLAHFAGGPARRVYLTISTNTVFGVNRRKKLAAMITAEVSELAELGFSFDDHEFAIKLPLQFDREQIARGFADDDLSTALAPIGVGLEKIKDARPILDRVEQAVRQFA